MVVQHPFQFGMLQASVIRRSVLLETRAFEEGLQHSEDFLAGVQVACRYKFAAIGDVVTHLYRTSDLARSSLDLAGRNDIDYYRARLMAYSLIAQSRHEKCWGKLYAGTVRGLCRLLAERGQRLGRLPLDQFRYGISVQSALFLCAAMLGPHGIKIWKALSKAARAVTKNEGYFYLAHSVPQRRISSGGERRA
jgi:hypothetical protein